MDALTHQDLPPANGNVIENINRQNSGKMGSKQYF